MNEESYQGIINRLSWSGTVIKIMCLAMVFYVGIYVNPDNLFRFEFSVFTFWLLDAHFLASERIMRIRSIGDKPKYTHNYYWWKSFWSQTLLVYYFMFCGVFIWFLSQPESLFPFM